MKLFNALKATIVLCAVSCFFVAAGENTTNLVNGRLQIKGKVGTNNLSVTVSNVKTNKVK